MVLGSSIKVPFKNLYNETFVRNLARYIHQYHNSFKKDEYISYVLNHLESLELKERMRLISSLYAFLECSYVQAIDILIKVN